MQKNKFDIAELKHYNHIHMIGIGGISMSGIAETLNNWGFLVTGSDTSKSDITDKLIGNHIQVSIGHDLKNIHHADLVVYSAAVKQDDPELCEAKNLNIPTIERGEFLGIITKSYLDTIGVAGTHGKTTTTSIISLCFVEAGLDPTVQVGAILRPLNGNYRIGNSNYFILEACEYAESFLKFHLKSEIVLNIDNDHLDYFGSLENIKKSFIKSAEKLPQAGFLVLNADDSNCLDLQNFSKATAVTYGLENCEADFTAKNIVFDHNGFASFDVYKKGEFYEHMELSTVGKHNISNSLACIALCDSYHLPKDAIKRTLKNFTGARQKI